MVNGIRWTASYPKYGLIGHWEAKKAMEARPFMAWEAS